MNNVQTLSDDDLKKIDFIVGVDHSGSMGSPSTRFVGKSRLLEVMEDVIAIARLAEAHDDDGITAIGFSSAINVKDGVKSDTVANIFKEFPARGSTNLTGCLEAILEKVKSSSKEVVAIVYTDGEPDSRETVITAIKKAAQLAGRPKLGIVFVQVGDDQGAADFLAKLNNDLEAQGVPDIVACCTAQQAESLSVGQLAWLARNA